MLNSRSEQGLSGLHNSIQVAVGFGKMEGQEEKQFKEQERFAFSDYIKAGKHYFKVLVSSLLFVSTGAFVNKLWPKRGDNNEQSLTAEIQKTPLIKVENKLGPDSEIFFHSKVDSENDLMPSFSDEASSHLQFKKLALSENNIDNPFEKNTAIEQAFTLKNIRRLLSTSTDTSINNWNPSKNYIVTEGSSLSLTVSGEFLYALSGNIIKTIAVKNIQNSTPDWIEISNIKPRFTTGLGSYQLPRASSVTAFGNFAYIADRFFGLRIINITDPTSLELTGAYQINSPVHGLTFANSLVFMTSNAGLHVLNVTNPAMPNLISSFNTTNPAWSVEVVNNRAYVAGQGKLYIIDISSLPAPELLGVYGNNTQAAPSGLAVVGNLTYLVAKSHLDILNTVDPGNIIRLGRYDRLNSVSSIKVTNDQIAFLADELGAGLQVLNVTDSSAPAFLSSYNSADEIEDIAVYGSLLALATGNSGVNLVSVDNPALPVLVGRYNTPGYASGVFFHQDRVLVADDNYGLQTVGLHYDWKLRMIPVFSSAGNDTLQLQITDWLGQTNNYPLSVRVNLRPKVAFSPSGVTADFGGPSVTLQLPNNLFNDTDGPALNFDSFVFSLANTASLPDWIQPSLAPKLVNTLTREIKAMAIVKNLLLFADSAGIRISSITNSGDLISLGNYDSQISNPIDMAAKDNLTFLLYPNHGLYIVDISEPASPVLVGESLDLISSPENIAVNDNFALVAAGPDGLKIFSISDPTMPVLLSTYNTPDYAHGVAFINEQQVCIAGRFGLHIVDLNNVNSPSFIGSYATSGFVYKVAVKDNYLLVAGADGLSIIDVVNPAAPLLTGFYSLLNCQAVHILDSGKTALLIDSDFGLHVIDITDLTQPIFLANYPTVGAASNVVVGNNMAFIADDQQLQWVNIGLEAWDIAIQPVDSNHDLLQLKITATDIEGGSNSVSLPISVNNHAPSVQNQIFSQYVNVGGSFSFFVPEGIFGDVDNDELNYNVTGYENTDWLRFNPLIRQLASIQSPTLANVGTLQITVFADDGHLGAANTTFSLTINQLPFIQTPLINQYVLVNQNYTLNVNNVFKDPDANFLSISAQLDNGFPLPAWLHFDSNSTFFYGQPAFSDVGIYPIIMTADDRIGGQVSQTFYLKVNALPAVSGNIADITAHVGDFVRFTLPADLFSDRNNDILNYIAQLINGQPLPPWLKFDSISHEFSAFITRAEKGLYPIQIIASDGLGNATYQFNFSIPNQPPVPAQSISTEQAEIWQKFDMSIPAEAINDPDGDPLSYHLQLPGGDRLPSWMNFNQDSRTITGIPSSTPWSAGDLELELIASDGAASASTKFKISVNYQLFLRIILGSYSAFGALFALLSIGVKGLRKWRLDAIQQQLTKALPERTVSINDLTQQENIKHIKKLYEELKNAINHVDNLVENIGVLDATKNFINEMKKQLFIKNDSAKNILKVGDIFILVKPLIFKVKNLLAERALQDSSCCRKKSVPQNVNYISVNITSDWELTSALHELLDLIILMESVNRRTILAEHRLFLKSELDKILSQMPTAKVNKTTDKAISDSTVELLYLIERCRSAVILMKENSTILGFLKELGKVIFSGPLGILNTYWHFNDLPSKWMSQLIILDYKIITHKNLIQYSLSGDLGLDEKPVSESVIDMPLPPAGTSTAKLEEWFETQLNSWQWGFRHDWRFVYGTIAGLEKLLKEAINTGGGRQPKECLEVYSSEGFSRFKICRCNGLWFFQNRNAWIRQRASFALGDEEKKVDGRSSIELVSRNIFSPAS